MPVKTYGKAQKNNHKQERLDDLKCNNPEFRVEELGKNDDCETLSKSTPWGNGTYAVDSFIVNLMQRGVSRGWIENYHSDFFRDGQTFENSERPYIFVIRTSGTKLIPYNVLQSEYDSSLEEMLERNYFESGYYQKGTVKMFYIDTGFVGEIVI